MSAMTAESKAALRSVLRARRREAAAARDREADARRLADHVLALVASRHPDGGVCRVAAYVALPSEPPTDRLVAALEEAGHEVILPVLLPDRSLDWMRADPDAAGETGVAAGPGAADLRGEPDLLGPDAIGSADVILTPGLAVDRQGTRVGQGGGSYDRALTRRRPDALVVTLLHDGELADAPLPRERHDIRVDAVLSADAGLVSCRASG